MKHDCSRSVSDAFSFRGRLCSKNGKYFEDGKWWCGIHAPSKVARRDAKVKKRWEERDAALERKYRRIEAISDLIELNRRFFGPGMNDDDFRGEANRLLSIIDGGEQ